MEKFDISEFFTGIEEVDHEKTKKNIQKALKPKKEVNIYQVTITGTKVSGQSDDRKGTTYFVIDNAEYKKLVQREIYKVLTDNSFAADLNRPYNAGSWNDNVRTMRQVLTGIYFKASNSSNYSNCNKTDWSTKQLQQINKIFRKIGLNTFDFGV